jgi:hypothetical protein
MKDSLERMDSGSLFCLLRFNSSDFFSAFASSIHWQVKGIKCKVFRTARRLTGFA